MRSFPLPRAQRLSRLTRRGGGAAGLSLLLLAAACSGNQTALDPQGVGAAAVYRLWLLFFWIAVAVFAAVIAALFWAMLRRRGAADLAPEEPSESAPGERRLGLLLKAGTAVTTAILLVLTLASYSAGTALFTPQNGTTRIELIGHRWWWEVRYPDDRVVTANEIHIPAGEPVEAVLRADDVIHSLWVPNLHGKMDLIPGQTNRLVFSADRTGTWRGQCAEFCGLQHAFMALYLVAMPGGAFSRWREQQQKPAPEPANDAERQGRQVFADNCAVCHAVRGFREDGKNGPDLTHVASRLSLAAGRLDNSRGNRAGWISNAPHLKPGTYMPEFRLRSDELQALLAYLDRLE